jgi:GT2 family glycosyltransferase
MSHSLDISVIVATCQRPDSLERAVHSIQAAWPTQSCELIVVENGSNSSSGLLSRLGFDTGNSLYLSSPVANKSQALNTALDLCRGNLIVFSDDDVIVSRDWLSELFRISSERPDEFLFCGPVVPDWPCEAPAWIKTHPGCCVAFGDFQPKLPEGRLPLPYTPIGSNFAVPRQAVGNLRFRLDLGPSQANGDLMCEDTAFVDELRDRNFVYYSTVECTFAPKASVRHIIAPHKLEFPWLMRRAYSLGRSHVISFRRIAHLAPKVFCMTMSEFCDPPMALTCGAELNFYCGQLEQWKRQDDTCNAAYLCELLRRMRVDDRLDYLCNVARQTWLAAGERTP